MVPRDRCSFLAVSLSFFYFTLSSSIIARSSSGLSTKVAWFLDFLISSVGMDNDDCYRLVFFFGSTVCSPICSAYPFSSSSLCIDTSNNTSARSVFILLQHGHDKKDQCDYDVVISSFGATAGNLQRESRLPRSGSEWLISVDVVCNYHRSRSGIQQARGLLPFQLLPGDIYSGGSNAVKYRAYDTEFSRFTWGLIYQQFQGYNNGL